MVNAPRLLVLAGKGSSLEVVEEFVAADGNGGGEGPPSYFTCSVAEFVLQEDVHVKHGYVQVCICICT